MPDLLRLVHVNQYYYTSAEYLLHHIHISLGKVKRQGAYGQLLSQETKCRWLH